MDERYDENGNLKEKFIDSKTGIEYVLKEEYYITLAKNKLDETKENVDKWADDQKGPLSEYLMEKEKIEQNSVKEIEKYKYLNEIVNYISF